MAGIWPSAGANQILTDYLTGRSVYLGLFYKNGSPPQADWDLTYLTASSGEPTTGGYARQELTVSDFTIAAGLGQATGDPQTFTPSGADWGLIDGWFLADVVSGTSGVLIAIEQFSDGPYNILDTVPVIVIPALVVS